MSAYERVIVLQERVKRLEQALKLPLIFYAPGAVTTEQQDQWIKITNYTEITTAVMCNHIRKVLKTNDTI